MEAEGYYAFGLDREKRPIRTIASNAGHCLWSGIADPDKAARVCERLLQPDLWSGWGVRTLSADNPAYNPMSYQRGSIWPHDNAIIAAGLKRYGCDSAANQIARGMFDAAARFESYRLPEVFAGFQRAADSFPVPYRDANVPQAWAAGAVFHLIQTMLGLQADLPNETIFVDPSLPDWLPHIELNRLQFGQGRLDLRARREGTECRVEVNAHRGTRVNVRVERGSRPLE
jgi:glycogen debranching enzyme